MRFSVYCLAFYFTNREITTTWYYVNSRKHVDSEKSEFQMEFKPTTLRDLYSRMLYHWASGDSVLSKGQIVGIDWNRIARLHSHVLAHMNSLTASRCHIEASHMNSLTALRRRFLLILSLIITKPIHKTKAGKNFYRRNSYNLINFKTWVRVNRPPNKPIEKQHLVSDPI